MSLRDGDLRELLETHPTPHFSVAPDGEVTWCNRAAKRLLGAGARGSFGRPWTVLLRPSERERAGPLPEPGRWTFVDQGGAPIDVRVSRVFTDGPGRDDAHFVFEDMRAEADIRRALARREAALREVSSSIPGAIFEYLVFPDGTDKVTYISAGCFDLWELEAEEVERDASALWAQIHPEDLPAMQASVASSAEEGSQWIHQWRITTPSGRTKWLQGNGQPTKQDDGSVRWNSCILDVTERVRAQMAREQLDGQLRQAQQLEALGRVAGGVAHDFNNVLTIILGLGEAALDQVDEGSRLHADLSDLLGAAERSVDLVSQLLAFSRSQPGIVKKVHVCRRVAETRRLLARLVPAHIELEYEAGDPCPDTACWVALEPGNVDQIVANLVLNARDAMPDGGRILVRSLEAESEDGHPGVAIFVQDEGVGMDEDTRTRVFEPFFSTKGQYGTGIGLSTVAGIVERVGGTVRVESTPGEGTTIGVWLPTCSPPVDAEPTATTGDDATEAVAATLLVVEDEPQVRDFVKTALSNAGYVVHVAGDADEALAIVEDLGDGIDAVLSDTVLPGPSGLDVVAEIRRNHPDIPALLMTGYVTDEALWAQIEAAGVPVMKKPFRLRELLDRIAELLGDPRG